MISQDSDIEYLSEFDFEWGYEYVVKVKERRLSEDISDGTRYEYDYIKTKSKNRLSDTVEIQLTIAPNRYHYVSEDISERNNTLEQVDKNTYIYFDEVKILLPDSLVDAFQKKVNTKAAFRPAFRFGTGNKLHLVRL